LADPTKLTPANPSAGSGPYVYDPSQSTTGDHYTYLARQGYWDKSKQHFKKIVLRVIANPQAAVNALRTGQVDVVTGGDATTTQQVSDSGFRVTALPFVWQGLNLIDRDGFVSKPLGDVRVRQAINYAIDRKTVAKAVLGRYGVPTVETVVRGGDGWSAKDAKMYAYNPAKAKQLLTAAGYPDGFTLPVMSIVFAGIDTMAQAVAGELAKVGITVKLTSSTDVGTYIGGLTKQQYPAVAVGYGAQPMYLMGTGLFLPVAPLFNGFHTSRAKLSDLYTKAAAADADQRAKLDTQMQEYLVENAWFAPVAFSPVFYFSNTKIKGVKVSANAPTASPLDWYLIK
jgi:peptide/nickel transport system substrate-binding protein